MSWLVKQVFIAAELNHVWDTLADFGNVARWAPTVIESHCTTPASRGVGATRNQTVVTGETVEEIIVEWNEHRNFTFEIPNGLASIIKTLRETWSVETFAAGTRVTVTMQYAMKGGWLGTLFDQLMVKQKLQGMLIQNLAGLKCHVETGEIITRQTRLPLDAVV
jgi:hypothetical protein